MEFYTPRKIKFKAWNEETQLLMRLNSIESVKGELIKKDHILLQFTGMVDRQDEELYELDVILLGAEKFVIVWSVDLSGWFLRKLSDPALSEPLAKENSGKATRLWSYLESGKKK